MKNPSFKFLFFSREDLRKDNLQIEEIIVLPIAKGGAIEFSGGGNH